MFDYVQRRRQEIHGQINSWTPTLMWWLTFLLKVTVFFTFFFVIVAVCIGIVVFCGFMGFMTYSFLFYMFVPPLEHSYPLTFSLEPIPNQPGDYQLSAFAILSHSNAHQLKYRASSHLVYENLPSVFDPQLITDFSALLTTTESFQTSQNVLDTPLLNTLSQQLGEHSLRSFLNEKKHMSLPGFLYPREHYDIVLKLNTVHMAALPSGLVSQEVLSGGSSNNNNQQHQQQYPQTTQTKTTTQQQYEISDKLHTKPYNVEVEFFNIDLHQYQMNNVLKVTKQQHLNKIKKKIDETKILLSYANLLQNNLERSSHLQQQLDDLHILYKNLANDNTQQQQQQNQHSSSSKQQQQQHLSSHHHTIPSPTNFLDPNVLTLVASTQRNIKPYLHYISPFDKQQEELFLQHQYIPPPYQQTSHTIHTTATRTTTQQQQHGNIDGHHQQQQYADIQYPSNPILKLINLIFLLWDYFIGLINLMISPICYILNIMDIIINNIYHILYVITKKFNLHHIFFSQKMTSTSLLLVQDYIDYHPLMPTHAIKLVIKPLHGSVTYSNEWSDLQFISSAQIKFFRIPQDGLLWFLYHYETSSTILGTILFTIMYFTLLNIFVVPMGTVILYLFYTLNNTNQYINNNTNNNSIVMYQQQQQYRNNNINRQSNTPSTTTTTTTATSGASSSTTSTSNPQQLVSLSSI